MEFLAGRHHIGIEARASAQQFELTIVDALFYITDYLKRRSEIAEIGAKYTLPHVLRSITFAGFYLPTFDAIPAEIESVIGIINCR